MNKAQAPLKAVVVGCRMGAGHADCFARVPSYELSAVCDMNDETARSCAEKSGTAGVYTDYATMLREIKPDIVAIATPNASHASLTLQAIEAGVRGICCEKPMAVHLADGRRMVEACHAKKVPLIINHQRRMGADLVLIRQMMTDGILGQVKTIRGFCAGDILSDGTHLIDSLLWLAGDTGVVSVLGQVHRDLPEGIVEKKPGVKPGFRYGHPVETGGMAVITLKNSVRIEIACGDMIPECRVYQDYEVVGSKATVWRTGDKIGANLFICDGKPGTMVAGLENNSWPWKPVSSPDGTGPWRALDLPDTQEGIVKGDNPMMTSYRLFADTVNKGTPHPMSGDNALRGFEIIMAIYESARLRQKILLPLNQDRFPLEIMVEKGEL